MRHGHTRGLTDQHRIGSTANRCPLSVATSETWTKDGERQQRTDWHNAVCFGKLAEICGEYLKKGAKVRVAGPAL